MVILIIRRAGRDCCCSVLRNTLSNTSRRSYSFVTARFSPEGKDVRSFVEFLGGIRTSKIVALSTFPTRDLSTISQIIPIIRYYRCGPRTGRPCIVISGCRSTGLTARCLVASNEEGVTFLGKPLSCRVTTSEHHNCASTLGRTKVRVGPRCCVRLDKASFSLTDVAVTGGLSSNFVPSTVFTTSSVFTTTTVGRTVGENYRVPGSVTIINFDGDLVSLVASPAVAAIDRPSCGLNHYTYSVLRGVVAGPSLGVSGRVLGARFIVHRSAELGLDGGGLQWNFAGRTRSMVCFYTPFGLVTFGTWGGPK